MRTLLFFLAVLGLAYCACPELAGWHLVKDGECRGLHSKDTVSFSSVTQQAINRCAMFHEGKPVIIHNQEHQQYWMDRSPSTSEGFTIIGLVCNSQSQKWEWSDGSELDFKPPAGKYHIALDQPCKEGYGWDVHPDGYWSYGDSGYANAVFFCTTQLEQAAPGEDGCDDFADDAEDGVCYQVGTTAQTWQEAFMTCKKFGAELASIHNKKENDFIRRLAVAKSATNGVFIGASAQKDGTFGWIDGTAMDYENYYPGFPKKNFGDCIAMDTTETAGQWMNIDCTARLPVACIRAQNADADPVCTGEDYREGAIITSPGYPFTSAITCDYFLAVEAGKRVEVEIISLEANECCDSVRFYDGYLGAPLIVTVTGEVAKQKFTSTSNIMRVSWQPDGGVNVKGLVFTYHAV